MNPRNQPGPGFEDKVQLETVNHKARTSILFGIIAGVILALCMYLGLR